MLFWNSRFRQGCRSRLFLRHYVQPWKYGGLKLSDLGLASGRFQLSEDLTGS